MCREFAARYVEAHKREFKRLGVFGQWDKPYLTMDPHDEASIAGAFIDFFEKGYVYRGLKPVYWCIYDRTALAEAEVEYEDHVSSVDLDEVSGRRRRIVHGAKCGRRRQRARLDHHSLDASRQSRARVSSRLRIRRRRNIRGQTPAAKERLTAFADELQNRNRRGKAASGRAGNSRARNFSIRFSICRFRACSPITSRSSRAAASCTPRPGHGADDFRTGQQYGLEAYAPQDDEGRFIEGLPEYKGKTVFEANPDRHRDC